MVRCGFFAAFSSLVFLCGCQTETLTAPTVNAGSAAAGALAEYDADKNGRIDEVELDKAPALNAAKNSIDTNGDNTLDSSEIAARVKKIVGEEVGMLQFHCHVKLDGRPLEGATVTAVPEKWLGTQFRTATGVTDKQGRADLWMGLEGYPGMQCGIFKGQITKQDGGMELIPAEYNQDTTLGMEIALDLPTTERGMTFELKSASKPK